MGCCGSSPEPAAHRAPPDGDEVDSEKKARLEGAIRARQEAEERAAAETAAAAFDQPGRAALAALPPHLRLGITLPGMRDHYAKQFGSRSRSLCVKEANAAIPLNKYGRPTYPENDEINGYVNQYYIAKAAEADRLGLCERLRKAGSKHVGEATVFVSWHLGTPLETLHDALGQFIARHRLDPSRTFFWVCDYVIRQTDVTGDLDYLGDCVAAIGHTALSLNPWDKPTALGRSYCLTEVAATQSSGAKLDVLMSESQQEEFVKALGRREGLAPILAAIAQVDVRTAEARNKDEQAAILSALEAGAGAIDCNAVVVGLMREQLAGLARAALAVVLEAGGRATSVMIHNIGRLLEELGTRPEAEPLSREYLKACRDKFGALGEWTLRAVDDLAALLRAKGKVAEAETLMREAVEGRRKKFGPRHEKTLVAISNLAGLLNEVGQQAECERLMREVVEAKRKELGESHEQTLSAMNDLATQLYGWGMLAEAERLYSEALERYRAVLGPRHSATLTLVAVLAGLMQDQGKLSDAEPLMREAVEGCREVLGAQHPDTLLAVNNLAGLLQDQDRLAEAEPLYREAVKSSRESLGARHADTLDAVENLAILLDEKGRPKEAAKLRTESVENIAILKVFDSPAPPAIGHSAPSSKRSGPASERKSRVLDLLQTPSSEEVHGPTIRLVLDKLAAAGIEASEEAAAAALRQTDGHVGQAINRIKYKPKSPGAKSPGNKPPSPLKMAMAGVSEYLNNV